MRTWFVIIALTLLACFVVLAVRPDEWDTADTSATSKSPWFEVSVRKPASNQAFGGLFGLIPPDDLAFNHSSPGAASGVVEHDRLELTAEGWNLSIKTDRDGRVAFGTLLVFPSWLRRVGEDKPATLRCRPMDASIRLSGFRAWRSRVESWDKSTGYLRITTPPDADAVSGHFLVELATCENVESGRPLAWPNTPLTVRGGFSRLPHRVD